MEGGTVIKRPVVFSLAELEKYPTLADRYAATLPFKECDVRCEWCKGEWWDCSGQSCHVCKPTASYTRLRAKCIKRTGERWTWFSAARDKDDKCGERLGTLTYLPWEIRQQIIKALFSGRHDHDRDINEMSITPGIYSGIFPPRRSKYGGIRFASPSTKVEFEHYYLTKTNFSFGSPQVLEKFLDRLSIYHRSLLRSFTLEFGPGYPHGAIADWVAVCARLPPNLLSIRFKVWGFDVIGGASGEPWFFRARAWRGFRRTLTLLEILSARARRRAARAKIGLLDYFEKPQNIQEEDTVFEVFHELEPWSKVWLEWWEEATKIDLDDIEGASNVARVIETR